MMEFYASLHEESKLTLPAQQLARLDSAAALRIRECEPMHSPACVTQNIVRMGPIKPVLARSRRNIAQNRYSSLL